MKTLVFDPVSGAAGDMILAGLMHLGADREAVCRMVESAVPVTVSVEEVVKRGVSAVDGQIHVPAETHHRHYHELVDIIKNAGLLPEIEASALGVFAILAEAESAVHGKSLDRLHFHEVGQNDALADVIGSCTALHNLGADTVLCTPVNVGGGTVRAAHGRMPVPAPATRAILEKGGLPFYNDGQRELLTPTGAALLTWFADPVETVPEGKVLATGYGAGDADTERPNVLKMLLVETAE